MARVLVSAATGATNAVLMKLDDLLRRECTMFTGMRGDIMFLKAELEYMHAFLEKVSCVENPTQQDKLWMRDVRDLSYDIEDRIDLSFIVHVNDESIEPKRFWGFIIERSMSLLTQVKTHYLIAKEIHGLKERIKEVSERHGRSWHLARTFPRCAAADMSVLLSQLTVVNPVRPSTAPVHPSTVHRPPCRPCSRPRHLVTVTLEPAEQEEEPREELAYVRFRRAPDEHRQRRRPRRHHRHP
ncbi:hypothetical protein PR202_ga20771 [Eleusine coracana subsp. coracana]|uniref:Disease resistance N-terminal domain-containing protein n=1 Tax=Eleusine coracana subsp. coracana TaxID=191504 RepID=A0AAV5CZM8_ELECO|nr:hypothetical protein PR202_ga20771 [Eleusine coracana subsp. coracana]